MRVAIIEDDAAIREMYAFKLRARGYEVYTATDGVIGLDIIEKNRPHLILLDIKMPVLPGNEVLKRIRSTEWGQAIKVIVLTNISRREAPADFRFLKVNSYIVKVHYTPSQVMQEIEKVLQSS